MLGVVNRDVQRSIPRCPARCTAVLSIIYRDARLGVPQRLASCTVVYSDARRGISYRDARRDVPQYPAVLMDFPLMTVSAVFSCLYLAQRHVTYGFLLSLPTHPSG